MKPFNCIVAELEKIGTWGRKGDKINAQAVLDNAKRMYNELKQDKEVGKHKNWILKNFDHFQNKINGI